MSYYVRPMTKEDLADVTEIDRQAFPTQWPPADYNYEFKNRLAHYLVACDARRYAEDQDSARQTASAPGSWFGRLFGRRHRATEGAQAPRHYVVGFAGFWIMAGEAHVTAIAVREEERRRGVGQMVLVAVLDLAKELGADVVTLEVRASNVAAQKLYEKCGFNRAGERRGYYLDRGRAGDSREDAIIMTTDELRSPAFQERLQKLKQAMVTG